ncbi:hypothetical protein [Kaistella palustris]|uniref:hypothetical protein n=1 Tax=Kaistella palustris TaxID=493376 RepID=UPI0003FFF98E|nr:hypothetical protein [Kaistella palustris]
MKKVATVLLLICFISGISQTYSVKENRADENSTVAAAKDFIISYYTDFTTEYLQDGKEKTLSKNYKASFSGAFFKLTFDTFDEEDHQSHHQIEFDFKNVSEIKPYGGETVTIHGTETEQIPVALHIGFTIKDKTETVNIYVNDEDDITRTPIYKAFETIWKYYYSDKMAQRKQDEAAERFKRKKNTEWPKPNQQRVEAEKKAQEDFKNRKN